MNCDLINLAGDADRFLYPMSVRTLVNSGLASNYQTVVWSSTPGSDYMVLANTNLAQLFTPVSGVFRLANFPLPPARTFHPRPRRRNFSRPKSRLDGKKPAGTGFIITRLFW